MTTNKLEVNHDLINTNFQSYRYNRDVQCSVLAKSFPDDSKLHTFKLNNTDYSYCHVAMSSGINNLYHDRHNATKVYLISDRGEILTTVFAKKQLNLKSVFTIPDFHAETMYASLSFPSESKAIVLLSSKQNVQKVNVRVSDDQLEHLERTNQQVKFFILKRNTLQGFETWDVEFSLDIPPQKCLYSDLNIIVSSHLHLYDSTLADDETLRLVVGSVYECFHIDPAANNDKNKLKSLFGSIFHQIQLHLSQPDNSPKWSIAENKRFVDDARMSNDFPKYASLGNNNDIVFVSNFKLKYKRTDLSLFDSKDELTDETILIAAGDLNEKEAVDEDALKEVEQAETEAIKKAKFTKAVFDEYETCDLTDSATSLLMTRFDCTSGNLLQEFDLSSQQWLFSMTNYSPQNRLPFFVTRHDVDAFIYEPQLIVPIDEAGDDDHPNGQTFTVKHIDSFPAFGYVFASKQHRRFVTFCQTISSSSTVFNNAVIDNWIDQLLYVYNKPVNQESANGQQFLFYYNSNEAPEKADCSIINGLCALPSLSASSNEKSHNFIYVLTEDTLYLIQF